MRIRGADTELQQAGLDTEGMAESTAKLRQEVMALSGVDITKNENEFKSTYDVLDELSTKWADLTDIQQASLTELIAGELIAFARMYRNIHLAILIWSPSMLFLFRSPRSTIPLT